LLCTALMLLPARDSNLRLPGFPSHEPQP